MINIYLLLLAALLHLNNSDAMPYPSFFRKHWRSDTIPNPMLDPLQCGRHTGVSKSAVCDPDRVLSKDSQDEIEGYINGISNAQVAVVIINKIDFNEFTPPANNGEQATEKLAVALHDKWGIGSAEKNDGVLVLLAITDRAMYISTGRGVEDRLTGERILEIIDLIRPSLKNHKYDEALAHCVIDIGLLLNGESLPVTHKEGTSWLTVVFFIIAVGFTAFWAYREGLRIKNLERGRIALDQLMHGVENNTEAGNKFFVPSCPICLEDFETNADVKSVNSLDESGQQPSSHSDVVQNTVNSDPAASATNTGSVDDRTHNLETEALESTNSTVDGTVSTDSNREEEKKESAKEAPKKGLKPMALRCGHTFCSECLETFLRSADGTKCPICRMPVHESLDSGNDHGNSDQQQRRRNLPTEPNAGPGSSAAGNTSSGQSCAERFAADNVSHSSSTDSFAYRAPEIRFRLNRMRLLYPDVMTTELLRNMNSAVDRGSITDLRSGLVGRSAEVQRTVTELRAANAARARSSGRRGASGGSGFSGGRRSGGGGGGW